MQINRYNYEEYFLLYTDNELDTPERAAVEAFITINPDLKEELALLQQFKMVAEKTVFPDKKNLLKIADNHFIHADNYEECFLLYADNELNNHNKELVEQYVHDRPELKEAFDLIGKAVLAGDDSIHFPHKQSLLRYEKEVVTAMSWWKMAAAAIVVMAAGVLWLNNPSVKNQHLAQQKGSNSSKQETASGSKRSAEHKAPINQPAGNQISSADSTYTSTAKRHSEPKAPYLPDNKSTGGKSVRSGADYARHVQSKVENTIQVQAANNTAFSTISSSVIKSQKPVTDEPVAINSSFPENNDAGSGVVFASGNDTEDVYISNIPFDKKHALRGLFRKASRMINKATGINAGEKGIIIGNVEIALK